MVIPQKSKKKYFTYAEYKNWPDKERWEIIDREAYDKSKLSEKGCTGFPDVIIEMISPSKVSQGQIKNDIYTKKRHKRILNCSSRR